MTAENKQAMPELPVVAWRTSSLDTGWKTTYMKRVAEIWVEQGCEVEPLCKVSDALTYAESLRAQLEAARAALVLAKHAIQAAHEQSDDAELHYGYEHTLRQIEAALRTELSAAQAEPVGTLQYVYEGGHIGYAINLIPENIPDGAPLYTTLPPKTSIGGENNERVAHLLANPKELTKFVKAAEQNADDWIAMNREFAEYRQANPPSTSIGGEVTKLWLWKNFVDGKPEYCAFDNPYPIHLDNGDPQTLGQPCGYAIVKPSRTGRTDVSAEQVLTAIAATPTKPACGSKTAESETQPSLCITGGPQDAKDARLSRLQSDSAQLAWLTEGKRGSRIWNHVLEEHQKEGHNFLKDALVAATASTKPEGKP